MFKNINRPKLLSYTEIALIVILAAVPLFVSFPYRVNIFISWEGAYRISEGQTPFRDFGTSLGGMYWMIPAFFFKIFGPQLITLVKAQFFINVVSGLAFRSILKSCKVQYGIVFIAVVLYCFSFSFFNFWPWYNHSVIIYEFVGLAFLLKGINSTNVRSGYIWLILAALFTTFSFLTKQDGGGMAFMICNVLLVYIAFLEKRWLSLVTFIASFVIFFLIITQVIFSGGFSYWFNHGQAPHTARISVAEILEEFFSSSQWIKFYLFLILLIIIGRFAKWKFWLQQKHEMLFLLLVICILGEAAIFQVTSYTPPDNNIFFHSFAIAYLLHAFALGGMISFNGLKNVLLGAFGVMIWWSSIYWKYLQRMVDRVFPADTEVVSASGENVVNRKTYMLNKDTTEIPMSEWTFTNLKSFEKIYMPAPTVEGIERLMNMPLIKDKTKPLSVLNMTELTPLAVEIPYELESNQAYPLWYHLGVSMFNKEAEMFEQRIAALQYDLILFEEIPNLNNFFPFRTLDYLNKYYRKVDSFMAPRRGDTKGTIYVFVRP